MSLQQYDQTVDSTASTPVQAKRVWLRADADFLTEQTRFSYSTDGSTWKPFGRPFTTAFQLKTFQGVRFALFHYNTGGVAGGVADFDFMHVDEPHPRGLMQAIPVGRTITINSCRTRNTFAVDGLRSFHRRRSQDSGASRCGGRRGSSRSRRSPTARATVSLRAGARVMPRRSSGWRRSTAISCSCRSRRTAICESSRTDD